MNYMRVEEHKNPPVAMLSQRLPLFPKELPKKVTASYQHINKFYNYRDFSIYIQWNLYIKDTLGPAIFVLNREVSSFQRLIIH